MRLVILSSGDLFQVPAKQLDCYILSPDAINNKNMKILACISSSNNNYGVFISAFKAIHHMAVAYVPGVISHHLLTHAPVQLDISLFSSPCFCSCSFSHLCHAHCVPSLPTMPVIIIMEPDCLCLNSRLPQTSCVTLGRCLDLSAPCFSRLQKEDNNSTNAQVCYDD